MTAREALTGEPGEFIAIVRKAGEKYFLGASPMKRHAKYLSNSIFWKSGKQYKAVIYADGENADWKSNPTDYTITEQTVTAEDTLTVRMAAGGGQAISFAPLTPL